MNPWQLRGLWLFLSNDKGSREPEPFNTLLDIRIYDIYIYIYILYSVMQSDGNSFRGDVVLGSFNMSYRDEDSILKQKYENQISWDLYHEDFIFHK